MKPQNLNILKYMEGKEIFSETSHERKWKFSIHHEDMEKRQVDAVEVDITFLPIIEKVGTNNAFVSGPHHKKIIEVDGHLMIVSPDNESQADFIIDHLQASEKGEPELVLTRLEWGTGQPREDVVLN